jgi:uncharacterized membrane protein
VLQLFLFLHVMGAIAVFGPTFAFPIIARHVRSAPQHGHFAAEVSHFIETRIVIPGAIVQGLTGLALILILGANLTTPPWRWLILAIALYLVAVLFAIFVQTPAASKMVAITSGGPPPGAAAFAGATGPGAPGGGGAPAGPPPEIAATARRLDLGGRFLTILIVVIVLLMVTKPSF